MYYVCGGDAMENFGKKLELAIKKLSLSRAGLAAAVAVDKSVAGRWVSGKVQPSAHNLARISKLIAEEIPQFSMLDWDRDYDDFVDFLGGAMEPSNVKSNTLWPLLPPKMSAEATHAAKERTLAYEGIWRTTRLSSDVPGRFLHDVAFVKRDKNGFLSFNSGVEGTYYQGSGILVNQKIYYFGASEAFGTISMGILNGVPRGRADVMDGALLTTLLDAGSSPAASGIYMERICNLTGDDDADDAKFQKLVEDQVMLAPSGSVPDKIATCLRQASNGPGLLAMLFNQSLARGPVITPEFGVSDRLAEETVEQS